MWKKIAGALLTLGFAGLTWAQQIDLNKASEVELDALKGVGPVLTKELMNERKKAPFKDWEDVTSRVKGLGPHKASSLSAQGVRVQGQAFASQRATPLAEAACPASLLPASPTQAAPMARSPWGATSARAGGHVTDGSGGVQASGASEGMAGTTTGGAAAGDGASVGTAGTPAAMSSSSGGRSLTSITCAGAMTVNQ